MRASPVRGAQTAAPNLNGRPAYPSCRAQPTIIDKLSSSRLPLESAGSLAPAKAACNPHAPQNAKTREGRAFFAFRTLALGYVSETTR